MNYDVEEALKDMEAYRKLGEFAEKEDLPNRVKFEQYLRAVIRGGDAIFLHFLNETPSDHRKAHFHFQSLYENNHIPDKYSRYKSNISDIMQEKEGVEYSSEHYSMRDFNKYKKKAVRFLDNAVKPILGKEEGLEIDQYF